VISAPLNLFPRARPSRRDTGRDDCGRRSGSDVGGGRTGVERKDLSCETSVRKRRTTTRLDLTRRKMRQLS
jgi:hypothetical protein